MSDKTLSKIQQLAGFKFPAVRESLHHLLKISQKELLDSVELVAAIELDPALLAVFLSIQTQHSEARSVDEFSRLDEWHLGIDKQIFRRIAPALANQYSTERFSEEAEAYFARQWQKSLFHGELCAVLARRMGADQASHRLLGLIAGMGHHFMARIYGDNYIELACKQLEPLGLMQFEQEQYGICGHQVAARVLESWGYSPAYTDALLYQYAELDALEEASTSVQIVAFAGRLLRESDPGQSIDENLVSTGLSLFKTSRSMLIQLVNEAKLNLEESLPRAETAAETETETESQSDFQYDLGLANIADNIETSILFKQLSIGEIAKLYFGVKATIHFQVVDGQLAAEISHADVLAVDTNSPNSQLAQSYQKNKFISIEREALSSIVDKQLLQRLGTASLWLLPLGREAGVLACGLASNRELVPPLLKVFQDTIAHQLKIVGESARPKFEIDYIQARVNEVTHEVNNPLAVAQNYLHTLSLKLDENSAAQDDIKSISREMVRVSGIVKKYGEIGRIENLPAEKIDVNSLLMNLVGIFRGGHDAISINVELDKEMPLVYVSPDSLKQVLVNIIKNAVEALEHEADAKIEISTHGSINLGGEPYVEVLVKDNGSGIVLPIRDKLFQPHNTGKGSGHSGLGLSIVKQLMSDMGGLITCKSQVAGEGVPGTSFQILIPLIVQKK